MTLDPKSRPFKAFVVPGMGLLKWIVLSMGFIPTYLTVPRIRVFPAEKKDKTHKVVQYLWSLNANTFVDKYSTNDVQEFIAETP